MGGVQHAAVHRGTTAHACVPIRFFFSFRRVALAAAPLSLEKSRSIGRKRRIGREEEVMVPFSLLPPRLQEGRPCVRRPSSILRMDADMAGWGLGCTTHG